MDGSNVIRDQLTKPKFWLKVFLGIALVTILGFAFRYFNVQALIQSTLLWVKNLGSTGIIAFILIYNLAAILFIPGSLLTLGGGALYGVGWGSLYVFVAATSGATIAFLIGRYVARDWVSQRIQNNAQFQAIDGAVAKEGLKIVLLTRLSPIFPFNLLNYGLGLTRVSLKDYVLGSVGMIPGTIMYVYIGSLAGDIATLGTVQNLTPQAQTAQWILKILGFLATVGVTVYITKIAKKTLNETVELTEQSLETALEPSQDSTESST